MRINEGADLSLSNPLIIPENRSIIIEGELTLESGNYLTIQSLGELIIDGGGLTQDSGYMNIGINGTLIIDNASRSLMTIIDFQIYFIFCL